MSQSDQAVLTSALDQLWEKFRPTIDERIELLRTAADRAFAEGLTAEARNAAGAAAHKLAGVLGTFGLSEGTLLAREAEQLCAEEVGAGSSSASRLSEIATGLQRIVANR